MRSRRTMWLLLVFFPLAILAAMGWVTKTLLEVDHEEQAAHRRANMEQHVRLALWRLDAKMGTLLANLPQPPEWTKGDAPIIKSGFYLKLDDKQLAVAPEGAYKPPVAQLENLLSSGIPKPTLSIDGLEEEDRNGLEALARHQYRATSPAQAHWIEGRLIVIQRANGNRVIGWVLDWPKLKALLLRDVHSLLNQGDLKACTVNTLPGRLMATLPVELHPGAEPSFYYARPSSPAQLMLLVAWSCIFLPAVGLAVLLFASYSLNERRDAFVSAVTHELRTPLTTFNMYTEMLEEGMVKAEKQPFYFSTLRREAIRLSHLVENVLTYARIERGKVRESAETLSLKELVGRVEDQLQQRSDRAGMALDIHLDHADSRLELVSASFERILTNLVDNACKYACEGDPKKIEIRAESKGDVLELTVRDYGPGIASKTQRKLFTAFSKTDREAAVSAPGVGLGLALSRRLARRMGGNLSLREHDGKGACFLLELPVCTQMD